MAQCYCWRAAEMVAASLAVKGEVAEMGVSVEAAVDAVIGEVVPIDDDPTEH